MSGEGAHHKAEVEDSQSFMTADKAVLLLGLVTYGIGQSILFITFPPLVEDIGLTISQFGFIMAGSNLVLAIAAAYWGKKSDKVGRKPMLLLGLFGYALGTLFVTLCLEWGVRGSPAPLLLFGAILFARVIYASLASAINPSATAYIADTTTREQRSRGMALIGMTSGIGTLLGPMLGGLFAFISVIAPMYFAICLSLLAMALIARVLKEPEKHETPMQQVAEKLSWLDPRVRGFLLLIFFFWTCFTTVQIIIAFYLEKHLGIEGSANVARAAASALFCMSIFALLMQTVVMQRFRITTRMMLRAGLPAFAAGLAVLYFGNSMVSVWVAFSLFGISMAFTNAGVSAGASLNVETHEQGSVGGLLSAAPILGMVMGPLVGPALFEQFSPTFPLLCGLILMLALSLYAFSIRVGEH
jgi:MFS family permease